MRLPADEAGHIRVIPVGPRMTPGPAKAADTGESDEMRRDSGSRTEGPCGILSDLISEQINFTEVSP